MALADHEQHTDLDIYEHRNKRDTCFEWPWRDKNDKCAFGVALAGRDQHIEVEWPWREKNAQSVFGVALVEQDRHVELEWHCVRTGVATRVSTSHGATKTINVRLEWPWLIEINTSSSTGPGEGRTHKVRLEWPWPVRTGFERSSLARAIRHRCVYLELPGPLQTHVYRFCPTREGRNTCREPCAKPGALQIDMSILIGQGNSKHALFDFQTAMPSRNTCYP